jgi:hypothetical protein
LTIGVYGRLSLPWGMAQDQDVLKYF